MFELNKMLFFPSVNEVGTLVYLWILHPFFLRERLYISSISLITREIIIVDLSVNRVPFGFAMYDRLTRNCSNERGKLSVDIRCDNNNNNNKWVISYVGRRSTYLRYVRCFFLVLLVLRPQPKHLQNIRNFSEKYERLNFFFANVDSEIHKFYYIN